MDSVYPDRRELLTALGASVVTAAAGCASDSNTGSPTEARGTGTTGGTKTTSADGDFSYPAGYSAAGIVDAEAAFESHVSFLTGLSNVTTSFSRRRFEDGTGRVLSSSTTRVDTGDERVRSAYEDTTHDKDLFFTNGTLYMYSNREGGRVDDPRKSALFSGDAPETFTEAATYFWSIFFPQILTQLAFQPAEPIERRGRIAVRYPVAGSSEDSELPGYEHQGELLVSSGSGTLATTIAYASTEGGSITEDGNRYEFGLSAVGDTSVETPSWYEG